MARFRIFLVSTPGHLDVDLPQGSLSEVRSTLETGHYLEGHLQEADEAGVCAPFLIPTNRLQMILEI
jgi:hypothetical protein